MNLRMINQGRAFHAFLPYNPCSLSFISPLAANISIPRCLTHFHDLLPSSCMSPLVCFPRRHHSHKFFSPLLLSFFFHSVLSILSMWPRCINALSPLLLQHVIFCCVPYNSWNSTILRANTNRTFLMLLLIFLCAVSQIFFK